MDNPDNTVSSIINAFTDLMCELPFSRISVVDICQKCNINRKSFYYHFKDKYDLMSCKFDMEFPCLSKQRDIFHEDLLLELSYYFYENRSYYRKAFRIEGQNSFTDHLQNRLSDHILKSCVCNKFRADFFATAITFALKEWMLDKSSVTPPEFYRQLNGCINNLSIKNK